MCFSVLCINCPPDEYDAGYNTCKKKQQGINLQTCPINENDPPPGGVAQCVGTGWSYIHVGGNIAQSFKLS